MGRKLVETMTPIDVDHFRRVELQFLVRIDGHQRVADVSLQI